MLPNVATSCTRRNSLVSGCIFKCIQIQYKLQHHVHPGKSELRDGEGGVHGHMDDLVLNLKTLSMYTESEF